MPTLRFDPRFDFAAQRPEIDRLGQQRLGAALQRLALASRRRHRR